MSRKRSECAVVRQNDLRPAVGWVALLCHFGVKLQSPCVWNTRPNPKMHLMSNLYGTSDFSTPHSFLSQGSQSAWLVPHLTEDDSALTSLSGFRLTFLTVPWNFCLSFEAALWAFGDKYDNKQLSSVWKFDLVLQGRSPWRIMHFTSSIHRYPRSRPIILYPKVALAIAYPLEHIFVSSYMSEVPSLWKYRFVTPIPKKTPHHLVSNYRPILLPFLLRKET